LAFALTSFANFEQVIAYWEQVLSRPVGKSLLKVSKMTLEQRPFDQMAFALALFF